MHIQTVLRTILERRNRDYYGVVLKASEVLEDDELCLCKMAAVVVAIVRYRRGAIDPLIEEFAAYCLNRYPNLIRAFARIGVDPPNPVAVAGSATQADGDGGAGSSG
jgi:hypothetical protein